MRLLEEYKTMEAAAEANRSRYFRKAEYYCYLRAQKCSREYTEANEGGPLYFFWLNMHYLLGLMRPRGRFDNSILSQ